MSVSPCSGPYKTSGKSSKMKANIHVTSQFIFITMSIIYHCCRQFLELVFVGCMFIVSFL